MRPRSKDDVLAGRSEEGQAGRHAPRVGQKDAHEEQRLRQREAEERVEEEPGQRYQVHRAHALGVVPGEDVCRLVGQHKRELVLGP